MAEGYLVTDSQVPIAPVSDPLSAQKRGLSKEPPIKKSTMTEKNQMPLTKVSEKVIEVLTQAGHIGGSYTSGKVKGAFEKLSEEDKKVFKSVLDNPDRFEGTMQRGTIDRLKEKRRDIEANIKSDPSLSQSSASSVQAPYATEKLQQEPPTGFQMPIPVAQQTRVDPQTGKNPVIKKVNATTGNKEVEEHIKRQQMHDKVEKEFGRGTMQQLDFIKGYVQDLKTGQVSDATPPSAPEPETISREDLQAYIRQVRPIIEEHEESRRADTSREQREAQSKDNSKSKAKNLKSWLTKLTRKQQEAQSKDNSKGDKTSKEKREEE